MRRVQKVTMLLSAALLSLPWFGAPSSPGAPNDSRPNVLIIITDDQRAAGTLKVMPKVKRWFRRGGTRFTNAFATTPVCCPSRASFFTGRYAHNHNVLTNQKDQAEKLDQRTTLQHYLQNAGYSTAIVGKYLNGWDYTQAPPFFDRFAIFRGNYYTSPFNIDGRIRQIRRYATDFIAHKSVKLLKSTEISDDRPWFLWIAPSAPHAPSTPEPDYSSARVPRFVHDPAMLESDRSDKPPYVQQSSVKLARVAERRRKQLRTLMSVNDLVKRVFATLRSNGELQNTLAFYVSDNGLLWGDHGLGGKGAPYTQSVQIPMYMRWTGHVTKRATKRRIVANIDVAPTIVEAAGLGGTAPMDGRPLLSSAARSRILLEMFGSNSRPDVRWAATVSRDRQYVEYFAGDSSTPTFREYYATASDPWQLRNLLGDPLTSNDPDVGSLSDQLDRDRRCAGADCP